MLQLQIDCCPRDKIDAVCETLDETAVLSVSLCDYQDDPILEPELGTTPLWPHVIVQALYAQQHEADVAIKLLSLHYPNLSYSLTSLPEKDWQRVCMDEFKPLQFGQKLWICPSWETPPETNAVNLILDPGLAFGTGTHATTHLCLTWLEQAALAGKTILDYGCGSGILALAALKLGATHAIAVDIDHQALIATQNNADTNKITANTLTIAPPDSVTTPVDVLIANILLTPLIDLKTRFRQLLRTDGILAVSGILETQIETVINAYNDTFSFQNTYTREGWAIVVFTPI